MLSGLYRPTWIAQPKLTSSWSLPYGAAALAAQPISTFAETGLSLPPVFCLGDLPPRLTPGADPTSVGLSAGFCRWRILAGIFTRSSTPLHQDFRPASSFNSVSYVPTGRLPQSMRNYVSYADNAPSSTVLDRQLTLVAATVDNRVVKTGWRSHTS